MTSCGGTSSVTKEAANGLRGAFLDCVGYAAEINDKRERLIWLEERWLKAQRPVQPPARANRGVVPKAAASRAGAL
jgi:hypothetical protein